MKEIQYCNVKLIATAKSKDMQFSNWLLTTKNVKIYSFGKKNLYVKTYAAAYRLELKSSRAKASCSAIDMDHVVLLSTF